MTSGYNLVVLKERIIRKQTARKMGILVYILGLCCENLGENGAGQEHSKAIRISRRKIKSE